MSRSFAHLWQDDALADVDIVLIVQTSQTQGAAEQLPGTQLAKVPAHRAILTLSPYLRAQILRWHLKRPAEEQAEQQPPAETQSPQPAPNSRPQIVLILQNAEQQQAAHTVLEALYATKPLPELLSALSQEQLLHAAVLADMWEVPDVGLEAVQQLTNAAQSSSGLSEAAMQHLLHMPVHPDYLQPLLKHVLLPLLGDLEAVWADEALAKTLLGLPLHVVEQLLSYDELQVACEDTVLYTAQKYVSRLENDAQRQHAMQKLAPAIRAPYLSTYWLSASVLSQESHKLVLNTQRDAVSRLLLARQADREAQEPLPLAKPLQNWPASWALGRRKEKKVECVQVTWQLDVGTLKEAAQRCMQQQGEGHLVSQTTPPFHGFRWRMRAICSLAADKASVQIGLYAQPTTLVQGMFHKSTFRISCGDFRSINCASPILCSGRNGRSKSWGVKDFFGVGSMAGGWDEAAWAAKGLPTTGSLIFTLTMKDVKMS